jgi:phage repressor protein C with HTH and peptisase S24 domain
VIHYETMDTPAKRLKLAREHRGVNQVQLASMAGVSPGTVGNIESGTRGIEKSALRLAKALGVSPQWLATGEGEMLPKVYSLKAETGYMSITGNSAHMELSNVEDAPQLMGARRVPVVGQVQGGVDGFLEELQYPVGHGEGYVEYWCKDPTAYAVRVKGDSMHPRYRAGEFVVVTPGIEAQPGSDVVVALQDGRKLLKQLNWQRDGEIQLLSINNHFAPLTLTLAEVQWVHRVAGSVGRDALIKG